MRLLCPALLLAFTVSTGSGAALAQSSELITRIKPAAMAKIMKDAGYRAEVVKKDDDTYIVTGLSGYRASVYFYDCDAEGCSALQLYAGFQKNDQYTLAYMNRWNRTKRYGKAYLDDDGSANVEFDVDLDGGVPAVYLKEKISLFEGVVASFAKF